MVDQSEERPFSVSIQGDGVKIEKDVSASVARQLIGLIVGGSGGYEPVPERPPGVSPSGRSGAEGSGTQVRRRSSVREFLEESQATRNPDKITAIGEYLMAHEGVEVFSREDIKGRFRQAGEAAPANFPRDFAWSIRNGWIAEDPSSSGSFYVTSKGRAAIDNRFSEDVKKATAKPIRRKPSRKAARA